MEIKFANKEDLKKLAEIEKICFPDQEAASLQQFEERFGAFAQNFLIVTVDEKIVGFINGATISNNTISDEMYEHVYLHQDYFPYQSVFGLAVLPEFRHKGIAHNLMNAFINLAKARQKKGMVLTCKEELISFYQQFGYVCLGQSQSQHGGALWYDMFLLFEN